MRMYCIQTIIMMMMMMKGMCIRVSFRDNDPRAMRIKFDTALRRLVYYNIAPKMFATRSTKL